MYLHVEYMFEVNDIFSTCELCTVSGWSPHCHNRELRPQSTTKHNGLSGLKIAQQSALHFDSESLNATSESRKVRGS